MFNTLFQKIRPAWQKSLNFYPIIAARYISYVKNPTTFHIMGPLNLAMVNRWAIQEGWNPGKHETKAFLSADPKGFWMSKMNGISVACLAAVRYKKLDNPFFAWLGAYIVLPKYRHQGYGKALWDHVQQTSLLKYKTIGLHSVMNQIKTYQKDGFNVPNGERSLIKRWMMIPEKQKFRYRKFNVEIISLKDVFKSKPNICMNDIMQYDARVFSTNRSDFLSEWFQMKQSKVFLAFDGDEIIGYSVLSATADGYKIAPLFAKDAHVAEELFIKSLSATSDASRVFVDTTMMNESSRDILKQLGFEEVFQTCTMYTADSNIPDFKYEYTFGITSQETSPL